MPGPFCTNVPPCSPSLVGAVPSRRAGRAYRRTAAIGQNRNIGSTAPPQVTMATSTPRGRRLRVYLVEDSSIIVGLLRDLLAVDPAIEVVGESTNAKTAIAGITALVPDVAVIDIALEDSSGFDVLRALSKLSTSVPTTLVVLSNFATERYRAEAARLGADYFFDKNGEILDLLKTLTAIAERDGSPSDSLL